MPVNVNRTLCPLCGQNNNCQVDQHTGCWCEAVVVPQGLLNQLPHGNRAPACICRSCIDRYYQHQGEL